MGRTVRSINVEGLKLAGALQSDVRRTRLNQIGTMRNPINPAPHVQLFIATAVIGGGMLIALWAGAAVLVTALGF